MTARLLVGGILLAAVVSASAPAVAADDQDSGTPLSVTITDGASPSPSASASNGGPSGGGGSAPGTGSSGGGSTLGGSKSGASGGAAGSSGGGAGGPQVVPVGEVSVAGMLYVGGLNGTTTPDFNPAEGWVDLWFTVRNASTSVIDASAEFSLDGAIFSNRLDTVRDVAITALQPGETRVVSASLHGAGQWTLLTGHVTLTPPESVDGTALSPVTRDGFFLLFPWFIVALAVVLALAWVIARVVRSALPPVPVVATT